MSDDLYNVIFRGDIIDGNSLVQVKERMGQLFKLDAAKVNELFSGKPVTLKKNCDKDTADKFKAALNKAGAVVSIKPATDAAVTPPRPPVTRPAGSGGEAVSPAPVPASKPQGQPVSWSLSKAGENLVRDDERPAVQPVNVSIDHIKIEKANPFATFVDEATPKVSATPEVQIDLSAYSVGKVGEDLLSDEEKRDYEELEIDLSHINITDMDGYLVRDEERVFLPPVEVDVSGIDLAPPGVELGQLKKEEPPPPPDTSHIKLA